MVGLGYVGLPTAALLANRGYRVRGVDIDADTVAGIKAGRLRIVEPGLDTLVHMAVESGSLEAATEPAPANVFILSVPTPFRSGYQPDLRHVEAAVAAVAPHLRPGNLLIIESTVPVGTTERVAEQLIELGVAVDDLSIAHCPERVLPGRAIRELTENDRIVGGRTPDDTALAAAFYRTFVTGEVLETTARTAEMAKLVENASRDTQIAFANEISILADREGVDVWELIRLVNNHPRVNVLRPGPGVGGHCIAVDPWFLISSHGEEAKLMHTARIRNTEKSEWVIGRIEERAREIAGGEDRPPRVAVMGLSYKPDIDDLRESPALYIARRLAAGGFEVKAVEPNLSFHDAFELLEPEYAVQWADIVAFLVAHRQFLDLHVPEAKLLDFCGVVFDREPSIV